MFKEEIPKEFLAIFTELTKALNPRGFGPEMAGVYWRVLKDLPMPAIRESARALAHSHFFPNTGDWYESAKLLETWTPPKPGSRSLDELDGLHHNDPERDEICKNLSDEDGDQLMKNYGYVKVGRQWVHQDDLPKVKP